MADGLEETDDLIFEKEIKPFLDSTPIKEHSKKTRLQEALKKYGTNDFKSFAKLKEAATGGGPIDGLESLMYRHAVMKVRVTKKETFRKRWQKNRLFPW